MPPLPPAARAIATAAAEAVTAARVATTAAPGAGRDTQDVPPTDRDTQDVPRTGRDAAPAAPDGDRAAAAEALTAAVERLATADPQRVALVLGGVVRSLLEELHPDGLDGEDLRAVLERTTRAGAAWDSGVDPAVLLVVLTGALGLSDPDEQPPLPPAAVARNAALLTADLLGPRPLAPYLTAALTELHRAETVELP